MSPPEDPEIPGDTVLREALLAGLSGAGSMGIMGIVAHLTGATLIFPSLGPTAFLLFYRPSASASSPRNTLGGHLIGALCGLGALAVTGLLEAPNALEAGVTWGRALAAALAMGSTAGLMVGLRLAHPPAGATTLIFALGLMTDLSDVFILMVGVTLLVAQAWITHSLAGTPYSHGRSARTRR